MSKRGFRANSWLQNMNGNLPLEGDLHPSENDSYSFERSALPPLPQEKAGFSPSRYLIPGWSGSSLFTKSAIAVKKLQESLWEDASSCFKTMGGFPRSLSLAIHNEFISFIERQGIAITSELSELKKLENFWAHLIKVSNAKDDSPHKEILESFIELYSFRVATNFLFRLKFLVTYANATGFEYSRSHILNPSSFAQQLFRRGSTHEITCEAFKINQYSWYRPCERLALEIEKLIPSFQELSVTQLMKINCYRGFNDCQKSIRFEDDSYSHALSHKSFGRFISQLLIFFPIWNSQEKFQYPREKFTLRPEVLNTLFTGDNVESLGQSHWLSQESNLNKSWSEILCPEFAANEKNGNTFVKLTQELQFLTFLVDFSNGKKMNTRELLSRVTREKFKKTKEQLGQFSLFSNKELAYDRIVLNVSKLPKKNPHHFLTQKILSQKDSLLDQGYMVVMSNQKLFVPSQSKKVSLLLKDFKIEGVFNLEKLKGKGEVTNFIYILKKRIGTQFNKDLLKLDPSSLVSKDENPQESCFTLRFSGELKQFLHFEAVVSEIQQFFMKKSSFSTSMYHQNLDYDLAFEFHQDAIIDGKLLSSLSGDNDHITHPHFFKNLTKSSIPFESLFTVDDLDAPNRNNLKQSLLGSANRSRHSGSHQILIVDLKDPLYPRIELCPSSTYSAKRQEYGEAFYNYYSITQKHPQFNYNLLRSFFESPIGEQIVQICLRGGVSKIKGRLRSLLIPKFLAEGINLEQSDFASSFLLKLTEKEILESDPKHFSIKVTNEITELQAKKGNSLWAYMSLLIHTRKSLALTLENSQETKKSGLGLNSPMALESLMELETFCVYPNEEVFTELLIDRKEDLDRPFSSTRLTHGDSPLLEVFSGNEVLIKFHAEVELLQFIDFVLSQASGHSLLSLLQNLYIPRLSELKELSSKVKNSRDSLKELLNNLDGLIHREFTDVLTRV